MEIVEKNETHILYSVHLSISSVVFKVIEEEQRACTSVQQISSN
jgi:hypothetical protein